MPLPLPQQRTPNRKLPLLIPDGSATKRKQFWQNDLGWIGRIKQDNDLSIHLGRAGERSLTCSIDKQAPFRRVSRVQSVVDDVHPMLCSVLGIILESFAVVHGSVRQVTCFQQPAIPAVLPPGSPIGKKHKQPPQETCKHD